MKIILFTMYFSSMQYMHFSNELFKENIFHLISPRENL